MAMTWKTFATLTAALIGASVTPAVAHPHVYVTHAATVLFDKGAISGIEQVWYFDEFYTAMAVEGLDTNKDGKFSREELQELAKTNMEGLKEFGYFTSSTLAGQEAKISDPADSWMEHKDGVLSLHFRNPLLKPVPAASKDFAFSIFDPSFFIAFEFIAKDPVKLGSGAPQRCKLTLGVPAAEAAQTKQLSGAFSQQLGGAGISGGVTQTVSVSCS